MLHYVISVIPHNPPNSVIDVGIFQFFNHTVETMVSQLQVDDTEWVLTTTINYYDRCANYYLTQTDVFTAGGVGALQIIVMMTYIYSFIVFCSHRETGYDHKK